jgi:hypothetical protein
MLLLVSGATQYPRSAEVGHLVVPKQWSAAQALTLEADRWAMDNGCFGGFDEGAFMRMLERFDGVPGCLFVTVPDVVGDASSTLARWPFWSRLVRGLGHRPALVAQDGLTAARVPWDELGALFIGGSTTYKESSEATTIVGLG